MGTLTSCTTTHTGCSCICLPIVKVLPSQCCFHATNSRGHCLIAISVRPEDARAGRLVHHTPGPQGIPRAGARAVVAGAVQPPIGVALATGEGRHWSTEVCKGLGVNSCRGCDTHHMHH
jgi:hypothetical protein